MPLFLSDEEYARCSHDPSLIARKADAYIRELYNQLETEKAPYDASSQIQAEKHQVYLQSIGKDGEIEWLSLEASELYKSKSQLLQLIEHKDLEINEKNASIKGYLDKIVALTDSASFKESRSSELEAELARVHTSLARLSLEKAYERIKLLEEELTGLRGEIITLRSQHDRSTLEAAFATEKLDRFMKDFEHQRKELNGVRARNVEFSQSIVDYQIKVREASEALHTAEDLSRKLNMEVSDVKREKELLVNSENRAFEEVRNLSERVHQLQATLNTFQSAEQVREEARSAQRINQEDRIKHTERGWAEARKELQEERDNVRKLKHEHNTAMRGAMQQIEEIRKELSNALCAVADANARAAKDGQLEEVKKIGLEILQLEQDLARSKVEIDERESKISSISQTETSLKSDIDMQKRFLVQLKHRCDNVVKEKEELKRRCDNFVKEKENVKRRCDNLVKKKEDLNKKNQQLSKDLADSNQVKRSSVASGTLASVVPAAQNLEESSKRTFLSKPKVETHKVAWTWVRPQILKPDQPKDDVDMVETVGANMQSSVRKRLSALSASEGQEGSHVRADVSAPLIKKSRGSEQPLEGVEVQMASDTPESFPSLTEESPGNGVDEKEETADAGRDEEVETGEHEGELQNDTSDIGKENPNRPPETDASEFQPKISESEPAQKQQVKGEAGSDSEEGEIVSDAIIVPTAAAVLVPPPVAEKTSNTSAMSEPGVANQDGSTLGSVSTSEVKLEEPVTDTSSTIINLNERARRRSLQRLAGTLPSSPPVVRGRGRAARGRTRGGRNARGRQTPGSEELLGNVMPPLILAPLIGPPAHYLHYQEGWAVNYFQ